MHRPRARALVVCLAAATLGTGSFAGCSSSLEAATPSCHATAAIPSDVAESNGVLETASQEHTPTALEMKSTAVLWGLAVLALNRGKLDSMIYQAPFSELLANTPVEYPSLFPSPETCTQAGVASQALITSDKDFKCDNDCTPSPKLLSNTGEALVDTLTKRLVTQLGNVGKLAKYKALLDARLATIMAARRAIEAEYATAKQVYTRGQQLVDLLDIVDKSISLADSQELVADVLVVMADVAKLSGAQSAGAVIVAFQIGWEIGKATNLISDCHAWKSAHCTAGWPGAWAGPYTFVVNGRSGCTFHHAGTFTVVISGAPGTWASTFELTGMQELHSPPGCELASTFTFPGELVNVALGDDTFSAAIAGDGLVQLSGRKASQVLQGTMTATAPDGTGAFTLTKQ